jgi:hypothetical protein
MDENNDENNLDIQKLTSDDAIFTNDLVKLYLFQIG